MALYDALLRLFTDEEAQHEFNDNPEGYLNSYSVGDVTAIDVQNEMSRVLAATQGNQSVANQGGFADFSGSGVVNLPPPPNYAAYTDAPDHGGLAGAIDTINHYSSVTNLTEQHYEDNDTSIVNDQDTIIDNSVNQDITAFGDVVQDFDTNVATGDGAVAGVYDSQVQTGDGIQVGGNVDDSNLVSGDVTNSTLADDITDSAVVSGSTVGGSVIGGDVTDSVVGDDNQAIVDSDVGAAAFGSGDATNIEAENANLGDGVIVDDSSISGNANFGDGTQTVVQDSAVSESSIGGGDVSSDDVNIDADDGAAVAFGGGDASGSDTDVDIDGDNFGTVQAAGNEADQTGLTDNSVDTSFEDSFNTTVEDNDTTTTDASINDSFDATDSFNTTVEDNDTTTDDDVIDIA